MGWGGVGVRSHYRGGGGGVGWGVGAGWMRERSLFRRQRGNVQFGRFYFTLVAAGERIRSSK